MKISINIKNVIKKHLVIAKWKVFSIFFSIIILTTLVCLFQLINLIIIRRPFLIGNYSVDDNYFSIISISKLANLFLISSPMFIIFSLIVTFFINTFIINELYKGKIFYWIIIGISRDKLIKAKFIFINLLLLLFVLPYFFIILLFSVISEDKNIFFLNILITLVTFIFTLFIFTNIYIFLSIYMFYNKFFYNSFIGVFLLILLLIHVFKIVYNLDSQNSFIKYFSLESFYLKEINFSLQITCFKLNINNVVLYRYSIIKNNMYLFLCFIVIQFVSLIFSIYFSFKKFKSIEIFI